LHPARNFEHPYGRYSKVCGEGGLKFSGQEGLGSRQRWIFLEGIVACIVKPSVEEVLTLYAVTQCTEGGGKALSPSLPPWELSN